MHKISRPGACDLTAIVPTKAVHTRYEKPGGRPTATFNEIILQHKESLNYLYFCRNRKARLEQRRVEPRTQLRRAPSREELVVGGSSVAVPPPRRQIHVLKLWLYALALVLFFGGWPAWKNDLNGTWCFDRNSPFYWLQGHAVWHVLTMGALGCIYWFFRSEKISYS